MRDGWGERRTQIVEKCVHKELNNFVLASILTVDDFMQFKNMMVKRNTDLTQEVRGSRCVCVHRGGRGLCMLAHVAC
jgi:hypothetical protein